MKWLFWASVAMLAYTYFGYAGWLWLRRRYRPRPVQIGEYRPFISIVMVVRNEAAVLERKLQNLLALNYPPELSEIIVFSDGSTDATNDMLREASIDPRVRIVLATQAHGKAVGLNIARAGRVASYALPGSVVRPAIARLQAQTAATESKTGQLKTSQPLQTPQP